ncbi:hypothetical protein BGZ49_004608, partial [Haplosporangium sp. Z 27]
MDVFRPKGSLSVHHRRAQNNSVVNLHDIDDNKVLLLGDKILSDIFDCTSKKRGLEPSESTVDIIVGTQMPALEPPRPLDNNENQDFIPNHIKEEDAESEFPVIDNSKLNFSMVSNQFGLSNLEEPNIEDLRPFEHIAKNVVQLDYISNRKRKFDDRDEDEHESDEDEDEDEDEDNNEYKDKSRDES